MMESVPGFKIQVIKCAFFGSDTNLGEVHMTELALESLEFSLTTTKMQYCFIRNNVMKRNEREQKTLRTDSSQCVKKVAVIGSRE